MKANRTFNLTPETGTQAEEIKKKGKKSGPKKAESKKPNTSQQTGRTRSQEPRVQVKVMIIIIIIIIEYKYVQICKSPANSGIYPYISYIS